MPRDERCNCHTVTVVCVVVPFVRGHRAVFPQSVYERASLVEMVWMRALIYDDPKGARVIVFERNGPIRVVAKAFLMVHREKSYPLKGDALVH